MKFQLSKYNKELCEFLKPIQIDAHGESITDPALEYYAGHTAQIEIVRQDRTMEKIVFQIPEICEYLTPETKHRTYVSTERDDQGSKVSDFFSAHEGIFAEMKWQKKLRGNVYSYFTKQFVIQSFTNTSSFSYAIALCCQSSELLP